MSEFNWDAYERWNNQLIEDNAPECECGEDDCACEELELRSEEAKDHYDDLAYQESVGK